jgi:hypothetical protein
MRYEFTDHEWAAIKPMLPNKPRGVPRVGAEQPDTTNSQPTTSAGIQFLAPDSRLRGNERNMIRPGLRPASGSRHPGAELLRASLFGSA